VCGSGTHRGSPVYDAAYHGWHLLRTYAAQHTDTGQQTRFIGIHGWFSMQLRVALTLLAVVLLLAACSGSATRGSGQLATESRKVSGFSKINLSGIGELTIQKTGTESLSISADDNLLPRLTSEVSNDTLVLGTKPNTTIVSKQPITYSVTVKDLTGVAVSGSGNIRVPDLTTTALSISIIGSGTIKVNGTANDQDLEISGSGRYEAAQLTSKTAKVHISGTGTANVLATDVLDVKISGSGTVTYTGNPQVRQEIIGSGKLIKR
jgi:putative autotransporter adhesin-like protein